MINHKFISFSAVQIYDISYIHLRKRQYCARYGKVASKGSVLTANARYRRIRWLGNVLKMNQFRIATAHLAEGTTWQKETWSAEKKKLAQNCHS